MCTPSKLIRNPARGSGSRWWASIRARHALQAHLDAAEDVREHVVG
jgi:hypothetical protein